MPEETTQVNTQEASAENAQTTGKLFESSENGKSQNEVPKKGTDKENLEVAPSDQTEQTTEKTSVPSEPQAKETVEQVGEQTQAPKEWGERHDDLANSGSKGVAELRKRKSGWIPNAWVRDDIGGIALPYGKTDAEVKAENKGRKTGYGLAHIDEGHPDLDWDLADEAIRNGKITEKSGNRIILEHASNDQKHRVVVQIDFDQISQNWLVTVYKKVAESPANPLTTAHDNKGVADNITPENSANNTIPQSAEKSSSDSKKSESKEQKPEVQSATDKITSSPAGSNIRIMAFTELADGEHTVNGKTFTKSGNTFTLDGKTLNAREIEKATRTLTEKIKAKPKAEEKPSDQSEVSDKSERIEDYGEKIGGARKDRYTDTIREKIVGNYTDEEIFGLSVDKLFPKLDYEKLAADGMKKSSIAILKAARETLPHKPSDKWKYKKNGYISAIRQTLEVAQSVLDGKMDLETLQKRVNDAYSELADLDRQLEEKKNKFPDGATVTQAEYNQNEKETLNIFKQKNDIYDRSRLARKLVDTAKVIELIDIPMSDYRFDYDITSNATYRDGKQDHDYRSYMIKRSIYSLTSRLNDEHSIKDVARVIEEDLKKRAESGKGKSTEKSTLPRTITIIAHAVSENNKRKLVYEIVSDTGRKGITLKDGFETAQAAAEFFKSEEGKAELEKRWAEFKDIKHYNPQESPRLGKDYRNGRNITAQELAKTFGFRGVEFGNWAGQNNRQKRLNETYDALMDMAAILDISPRAVGLGGKLGMAFGSRGSGWANAHFESDAFVINITKTRGAGSLAHEWLHALDNYFARQSESQHGMATDMHELNLKNMRDELKEKWMGLRRTLEMSAMKRRSNKHSDYWSRIWEVAARAFSRYIQDKAIANNMSNDYLVSLFPEELLADIQKETTPYALAEDMETITPAFDAFFETLQEKVDESGNTALFSKPGDLQTEQYAVENKLPDVPDGIDLKSASQVREYLIKMFNGKQFRIKSNGRLAAIDKNGIRDATKKRGLSRQSLFDAQNIVENSYQVGYRYADIRHLKENTKINGQFIYVALIDVEINNGGNKEIKPFAATIKLDDFATDKHAILKDIAVKEMTPAVRGTTGKNNIANPPVQVPDITIRQLVDFVKQGFANDPLFTENVLENFAERLDQAYFNAINRGDMETAQKMVENAAKRAGYITIAYHGTNAEFYVFDKGKFGLFDNGSKFRIAGVDKNGKLIIHTIKDEGFFFSAQEAVANDHAEGAVELAGGSPRTIAAYLKAKKPLIIEMDEFYADKKGYDTQDWYDKNTAEILDEFHKGDYDSIWVKNPVRPTKDNLYIVFESKQIKSADPVVYDDNGNIIPLSERFNPEKDDIRFSLTTDLGDTSLSPMDYRRSIDPLFDFVMEYTDNGIVNPGKEHEGEIFTGSFINRIFSDVPAMQQMNNATQLWHMDKFQWQENALPSSYSSTPCD